MAVHEIRLNTHVQNTSSDYRGSHSTLEVTQNKIFNSVVVFKLICFTEGIFPDFLSLVHYKRVLRFIASKRLKFI